jgi:hypothetical protein
VAKRWLPLTLALLAFALVACRGISPRKVRVLEDADSAVFNAVLRSVTINTSHGNEYLVVTSEPGAGYVIKNGLRPNSQLRER